MLFLKTLAPLATAGLFLFPLRLPPVDKVRKRDDSIEEVRTDDRGGAGILEANLAEFEASTQTLQYKNLQLRLRLQRRKSRAAFERSLLLIGIFLGLLVGSVSISGRL
jgi:hypothetical protein